MESPLHIDTVYSIVGPFAVTPRAAMRDYLRNRLADYADITREPTMHLIEMFLKDTDPASYDAFMNGDVSPLKTFV